MDDLPSQDENIRGKRLNSLRPKQNGCHFANSIVRFILMNENYFYFDSNFIEICSQKSNNNKIELEQLMAWQWSGDKLLSETVLVLSELTHWLLWDAAVILNENFQTHIKDRYLENFPWNCFQLHATRLHWKLVSIGSGNGLVPSGNKPLPEWMLTQIYVTLWHHLTTRS